MYLFECVSTKPKKKTIERNGREIVKIYVKTKSGQTKKCATISLGQSSKCKKTTIEMQLCNCNSNKYSQESASQTGNAPLYLNFSHGSLSESGNRLHTSTSLRAGRRLYPHQRINTLKI